MAGASASTPLLRAREMVSPSAGVATLLAARSKGREAAAGFHVERRRCCGCSHATLDLTLNNAAVLVSEASRGIVLGTLFAYVMEVAHLPAAEARSVVALAVALFSVGRFLSNLILGHIADRMPARFVLCLSLIVHGIGQGLYGVAGHLGLWALMLSRFLTGFGSGTSGVTCAIAANIVTPASRTKHFSILGLSRFVGYALTPSVAGFIVVNARVGPVAVTSNTVPGFIMAVACFALAAVILALMESDGRRPTLDAAGERVESHPPAAAEGVAAASASRDATSSSGGACACLRGAARSARNAATCPYSLATWGTIIFVAIALITKGVVTMAEATLAPDYASSVIDMDNDEEQDASTYILVLGLGGLAVYMFFVLKPVTNDAAAPGATTAADGAVTGVPEETNRPPLLTVGSGFIDTSALFADEDDEAAAVAHPDKHATIATRRHDSEDGTSAVDATAAPGPRPKSVSVYAAAATASGTSVSAPAACAPPPFAPSLPRVPSMSSAASDSTASQRATATIAAPPPHGWHVSSIELLRRSSVGERGAAGGGGAARDNSRSPDIAASRTASAETLPAEHLELARSLEQTLALASVAEAASATAGIAAAAHLSPTAASSGPMASRPPVGIPATMMAAPAAAAPRSRRGSGGDDGASVAGSVRSALTAIADGVGLAVSLTGGGRVRRGRREQDRESVGSRRSAAARGGRLLGRGGADGLYRDFDDALPGMHEGVGAGDDAGAADGDGDDDGEQSVQMVPLLPAKAPPAPRPGASSSRRPHRYLLPPPPPSPSPSASHPPQSPPGHAIGYGGVGLTIRAPAGAAADFGAGGKDSSSSTPSPPQMGAHDRRRCHLARACCRAGCARAMAPLLPCWRACGPRADPWLLLGSIIVTAIGAGLTSVPPTVPAFPVLTAGFILIWSLGAPAADILSSSMYSVMVSQRGGKQGGAMALISAAGSFGRIIYPLTFSVAGDLVGMLLAAATALLCAVAMAVFMCAQARADRAEAAAAERARDASHSPPAAAVVEVLSTPDRLRR